MSKLLVIVYSVLFGIFFTLWIFQRKKEKELLIELEKIKEKNDRLKAAAEFFSLQSDKYKFAYEIQHGDLIVLNMRRDIDFLLDQVRKIYQKEDLSADLAEFEKELEENFDETASVFNMEP